MKNNAITIIALVNAPIEKVWESWTMPSHIEKWAFASDDWMASNASNDLKIGGKFKTTMSAKDKSASFDFEGIYTAVKGHHLIEYDMSDGRQVRTIFESTPNGIKITQTFDPEDENPIEIQKDGWQEILNNFKKYTETL